MTVGECPGNSAKTKQDWSNLASAMHRGKRAARRDRAAKRREDAVAIREARVDQAAVRVGQLSASTHKRLRKQKGSRQSNELALAVKGMKPRDVTNSTQLQIAFPNGPMIDAAIVARQHKVHSHTVRRARESCAERFLLKQSAAIKALLDLFRRDPAQRPYLLIEKTKWDETRQRANAEVSMDTLGIKNIDPSLLGNRVKRQLALTGGSAESQPKAIGDDPTTTTTLSLCKRRKVGSRHNRAASKKSSIAAKAVRRLRGPRGNLANGMTAFRCTSLRTDNVMVQLKSLWWFNDRELSAHGRMLPIVVPSHLLPATSAAELDVSLSRYAVATVQELSECGKFILIVRESDAASSNISYVAEDTKPSKLPPNALYIHVLCCLHQLYLIIGLLLQVINTDKLELVGSLYQTAALMRTPGVYLHFLSHVKPTIRFFLDVRANHPPPSADAHNRKVLLACGWDPDTPQLTTFRTHFNGIWSESRCIIHYTGQPENADIDIERIVDTLAYLVISVLYSSLPIQPIASRWTKVFSNLQWNCPGLCIHGITTKVWRFSFDKSFSDETGASGADMRVDAMADECEEPRASGTDTQTFGSTEVPEWKRFLGKRMRASLSFFRDPVNVMQIAVLTSVINPLNYVTSWLFKNQAARSSAPLSPESPSLILDFQNAQYSPVHLVLQWMASVLFLPLEDGPLGHLVAVLPNGELNDEAIQMIHRLVMCAMSGLFLRFVWQFDKFPFKLISLADDRMSGDVHERTAQSLLDLTCPHCADRSMTTRVLENVLPPIPTIADVLGPLVRSIVKACAITVDGACDDVETRHARTRKDCHDNGGDRQLSCRYVLREVATIKDAFNNALSCETRPDIDAIEDAPATSGATKWGGIQFYHHKRLESLEKHGVPGNLRRIADPAQWGETKRSWDDELTDFEKDAYTVLASTRCNVDDPTVQADQMTKQPTVSSQSTAIVPYGAPPTSLHHDFTLGSQDFQSCHLSQTQLVSAWRKRSFNIEERDVQEAKRKAAAVSLPSIAADAPPADDHAGDAEEVDAGDPPDTDGPQCKCCQELGYCKVDWDDRGLRVSYFTAFQRELRKFLRSGCGCRQLCGKDILCKLLAFEGLMDADVKVTYYMWIGFGNGSPVFQIYHRCGVVTDCGDVIPYAVHIPSRW